jgi:dipeptidyl aminopeptidase/acylaminoacyl peptidase
MDSFWGIEDCEDVVSCLEYLSAKNMIDGSKVGITGESVGGYTVLNGIYMFSKVLAAGTSLLAVSNLKSLTQDTHKFESHYLYALIF